MGFEETKADFYPEKYGEYFASMSPLASKIYWDVQSAITDNQSHLSYSGKCVVIDKKLIYDPIHFSKDSHETNQETHVFYDDPILDQDHLSALLLNVHPKKSDKHVYEESVHWIDEHAVPYSSCTEAQAKACSLSKMVNKIHQNTYVRPVPSTKKYKAPSKPPSIPSVKAESQEPSSSKKKNERVMTQSKDDERGLIIKKPEGIIGVSVMGMTSPPPKIEKSKETEDRSKIKEQEAEDNLPQQVQNQNLIAELQAKLKKNREGSQTDSTSSPKPSSSSTQKGLHKPKAPPPPPPVVTKQPESKINTRGKTSNEDEFIVDVSSPCKIATPKTGFDFLDNW